MGDTDTTYLATGDSSHESIDALRSGVKTPQQKKTVLKVLVVLICLTAVGLGSWRLYEAIISEKKESRKVESDPICIGHVTKTMNNKVYVMNQPTESSVVTFTDVTYDSSWRMKPAWQQQDGKLVTATGLILTYHVAQDNFTLEKESNSPWQLQWQMDDSGSGKGILHTTDPNGMKKYLQVRTEWVTLSESRKLACLKDTEKAGSMDTPVYANKICRLPSQPSATAKLDDPANYDDAFLCEQANFKWGVPSWTPIGTAHPVWGPEIEPARCYRDDPCTYEDRESCESAKCKWGTPSWESNPDGGAMIQLRRCYRS